MRKYSYTQNWPAYNKAQIHEQEMLMKLLADLCRGVEQTKYKFGRPKLSLGDMIYISTLKVYSTFSLRRFMSLMKIAREKGHIDASCSYVSVSNYMNKLNLTDILLGLIEKSSLPLRTVEVDFAVDSTGFSTTQFGRWVDFRFGTDRRYRKWLKAHAIVGVKTNVICQAIVTESDAADHTFFEYLVKDTKRNFHINEVSADKAYSSEKNMEIVEKCGGIPFIPYKKNTKIALLPPRPSTKIWKKMYHYFRFREEEFMERYHKRSNVETCFHMVKAKFGSSVRSRKKVAQVNEILCKILCHNICVIIQEMHEMKSVGK